MYDRIIAAAMSYSAVVNYVGAVEIPLLPRHQRLLRAPPRHRLRSRHLPPLSAASWLRGHNSSHRRRARTPTCNGRLFPRRRYFQWTLFSTNARNYCVFVIILYSNRTGRPPTFPTAGPRQQEPPPIYALGGSRPPSFQFPAADIPSSSTPPMFQPTFDTATEEHLGWDQVEFGNVLVTLDAPQQADEVGPSQLTQATVWTQPTQPAAGGGTPAVEGHRRWRDTGRQRDTSGRRDTGGRSDISRRRDTRCCRLVAGGHGDTVSRPARTAGGPGT
jgi:hypothetical protein